MVTNEDNFCMKVVVLNEISKFIYNLSFYI